MAVRMEEKKRKASFVRWGRLGGEGGRPRLVEVAGKQEEGLVSLSVEFVLNHRARGIVARIFRSFRGRWDGWQRGFFGSSYKLTPNAGSLYNNNRAESKGRWVVAMLFFFLARLRLYPPAGLGPLSPSFGLVSSQLDTTERALLPRKPSQYPDPPCGGGCCCGCCCCGGICCCCC